MIKISIIVSIYNLENYIRKCLDSLIKQKNREIEIICVNDGSTDSSKEILEEYKLKDSRIKVINKKNGGISSARNVGLQYANGKYILFVDGDDYIDDITSDKLVSLLEQSDADTFFMGYYRQWVGGAIDKIYPKLNENLICEESIRKLFIPSIVGISLDKLYDWFNGKSLTSDNEFPSVWRFLYSRQIIEKHKIKFNEDVITGEDILFNLEYLKYSKKVYILRECFYYYVERIGSLTQSYDKKQKFYESKLKLLIERENLTKKLYDVDKMDYSSLYQGTIAVSTIQMALILSECKVDRLKQNFYLYKNYSNIYLVRECYEKLNLNHAPIKYKIPLFLCKYNLNFILFYLCYLLNKLKIDKYPK